MPETEPEGKVTETEPTETPPTVQTDVLRETTFAATVLSGLITYETETGPELTTTFGTKRGCVTFKVWLAIPTLRNA